MLVTPSFLYVTMQGAFLLFVQVIDDDDLTGDDHVDDIFIEMSLATSSLFTAPQTFVGSSNNARLELSFRVQCSPGFMGEDCTGKYRMSCT